METDLREKPKFRSLPVRTCGKNITYVSRRRQELKQQFPLKARHNPVKVVGDWIRFKNRLTEVIKASRDKVKQGLVKGERRPTPDPGYHVESNFARMSGELLNHRPHCQKKNQLKIKILGTKGKDTYSRVRCSISRRTDSTGFGAPPTEQRLGEWFCPY